MKSAALVFLVLLCVYLLSSGGQGYSVDGAFSYRAATSIATDPSLTFLRANADTFRRWGPLLAVLGAPFSWAGAQLSRAAPPRDSITLSGERLALRDWPAIGAPGSGETTQLTLDVPVVDEIGGIRAVRLVSFLSRGSAVPDGETVAELVLLDAAEGTLARASVRAGRETAEWAIDLPSTGRVAHQRAPLAGHWPGNPSANLYWADLPLTGPGSVRSVVIRHAGGQSTGRVHVRAVQLRGERGSIEVPGPIAWSERDQLNFFTRFGFSFVNAPIVALTCALLIPIGRGLGYDERTSAVVALMAGLATPLWPYAKFDFSEPAAAAAMIGAVALLVRNDLSAGRLVLAGGLLCAAAAARYTAVALLPILAIQVGLSNLRRSTREPLSRLVRAGVAIGWLVSVPVVGALVLAVVLRHLPTIWGGAGAGIAQGWLDFPLWNGVYGLLLSPGKGLLWYAPAAALAGAGLVSFVRRHRTSAIVYVALPLAYVLIYGSKGVWHGGGWGPRYLVPLIPFSVCWSLPVASRLMHGARRAARGAAIGLTALSAGAQLLGVLKHPNLYTVMFRDHVAPALRSYGQALGGTPARSYWMHFGGPVAARQLVRPASGLDPSSSRRGLGFAFAESGPLVLDAETSAPFVLTVYACDWDHRGRRQRVVVQGRADVATIDLNHDFSSCEYHSTSVREPGAVKITVEALQPRDVPVVSALFFDRRPPDTPSAGDGDWVGRVGRDGFVLFGWDRGRDVAALPPYVPRVDGGERVWVDTWEAELTDTALLYAPGFSPLLAHGWLLAADAASLVAPRSASLIERALASPPWRYVHELEVQSPHPEYGLGVDVWPVLLYAQFAAHPGVIAVAWAAYGAVALAGTGAMLALGHRLRWLLESRCAAG